MDQLQRDVLELLRYSLHHDPAAARLLFPRFEEAQIRALYEIPAATRERIWSRRAEPRYRSLFRATFPEPPAA